VAFTRPPEWLYPVIRAVNRVTEPILGPFRRLIPPVRLGGMGLDVSFIFVFLIVYFLRRATAY
jgi:YggT family protein